jgi:hypothetical protein
VVAVPVRDHDRIEPADDFLGRERQRDRRVPDGIRRLLDRRPRAGVVEHRVDEDPPSAKIQEHGRAAHEREPHSSRFYRMFALESAGSLAIRDANGWLYSAIRCRTTPLRSPWP